MVEWLSSRAGRAKRCVREEEREGARMPGSGRKRAVLEGVLAACNAFSGRRIKSVRVRAEEHVARSVVYLATVVEAQQ